ncbi:MAG: hypothetical protein ACKVI5_01790 [Nitrospinaceae bacterium]
MESSSYSMLVGGYKQSGGEGINLFLLQTLQHSQKVLIKVNILIGRWLIDTIQFQVGGLSLIYPSFVTHGVTRNKKWATE